jgi:CheY-like chemotaxis protein
MTVHVLIVDDQPTVRSGLRSLLASRPDWKVSGEAADGLEAIEKAKSLHPDLILMDVSMPRMNGLEATRLLRKEVPDAKVVIVSQNDPAVVSIQARQAGASGHVAKHELFGTLLPVLDRLVHPLEAESPPSSSENIPASSSIPDWLKGSGALGRLIGEYDWSKTPLGPIEAWPQSLKTAINLMLNSQHPMWIGWGPQATFLYNEAYVQVLGHAKHPWALGRPAL